MRCTKGRIVEDDRASEFGNRDRRAPLGVSLEGITYTRTSGQEKGGGGKKALGKEGGDQSTIESGWKIALRKAGCQKKKEKRKVGSEAQRRGNVSAGASRQEGDGRILNVNLPGRTSGK